MLKGAKNHGQLLLSFSAGMTPNSDKTFPPFYTLQSCSDLSHHCWMCKAGTGAGANDLSFGSGDTVGNLLRRPAERLVKTTVPC